MYREIFQITSILLTIESAFFLSKGNLGLSVQDIAELSSTKFGANLSVARNLATQNADNKIGILLLLISFILQMITSFFSSELSSRYSTSIFLISLLICVNIFLVCWKASKFESNRLYIKANEIIANKQVRH